MWAKFKFYQTTAECAANYGGKPNSVALFRNFDKSPVHYTGEPDSDPITDWMDIY